MRRKQADPRFSVLAQLSLFAACSQRELASIARSSTFMARPQQHVFATGGEFVVVLSGSVIEVREGCPLRVLGPGAWWGDAELLSGASSRSSFVALTDVECLVLSRCEFLRLFDEVATMRRRVVRSLAKAARSG